LTGTKLRKLPEVNLPFFQPKRQQDRSSFNYNGAFSAFKNVIAEDSLFLNLKSAQT